MTDLIPSLFVPVIFSNKRDVIRTARRLFWQYGVTTHVFGERLPLFCRLTPWIVCHILPQGLSNEFCVMALYDFSVEILECDRQPLLIICGDTSFSEQHLALLESSYLICREHELASILTPEQHLSEGGTLL